MPERHLQEAHDKHREEACVPGNWPRSRHEAQGGSPQLGHQRRDQDSGSVVVTLVQLQPEGRNREGRNPAQGSRGFGASEFDPSFQQFGVSETPSQRPLRAPEWLSEAPERLFRGLGEVCSFSTERENKVGHSEAPKRPRFPGCPLRGFQPSGSYPRATDTLVTGMKGRPTPKTTHPNESTACANNFGTLCTNSPPLSL